MDQAGTLRQRVRERRPGGSGDSPGPIGKVRVMAVTSGKGGVGKTNVVVNLALALAARGKRVLILDADLGLGNLDVLLGLAPRYNLEHVLSGEQDISDVLVKGPGGIGILPASSGVQEMTGLTDPQKIRLLSQLDTLESQVDILLIDTGAGISDNVTYFATAAQEILVVASPEPTSITDAYALMKVLSTRYGEGRFKLLANMVKSPQEGKEIYRKLTLVADRYLNISLDYLGYILQDDHVPWSVREQKAVLDLFPRARASLCFTQLAETVCRWDPPATLKGGIQFFWKKLIDPTGDEAAGNIPLTQRSTP